MSYPREDKVMREAIEAALAILAASAILWGGRTGARRTELRGPDDHRLRRRGQPLLTALHAAATTNARSSLPTDVRVQPDDLNGPLIFLSRSMPGLILT
jgi:hypothetical protein